MNADRAPQLKAVVMPFQMKSFLAILLMVCAASGALSQTKKAGVFSLQKKQGTHSVLLTVRTRPFRLSQHRVSQDEYQTTVDGRFAWGTDGNIPIIEISSIKLLFDGREIEVPKKLYVDCYEPSLDSGYLKMRFGPKFKSVIVSMTGSDGAGWYQVIWRLESNGHHTRSITGGS